MQVAIGLGLLYRRTTKPALAVSFAWAFIVWWFGEAFGMLFMNMANPLTGAPGAVLLYALIGLMVWPNGRPAGLLGIRGSKIMWSALWFVLAWVWLMEPSSSKNATSGAIEAAPSGMSWLSEVQRWAAEGAKGNGLVIALVLAALSVAIGLSVALNWRPRQFIIAAIVLNLLYWVVGQGFGGIIQGGATDPNAGFLFALLGLGHARARRPLRGWRREASRCRPAARASDEGTRRGAKRGGGGLGRWTRRPHAQRPAPHSRSPRLALLSGCAAANKEAATTSSASSTSAMNDANGSGSMAGMNMGANASAGSTGSVNVATAGGTIKPVPTQVLGSTTWQGMKITAQAMTVVPFEVYNGTSAQVVKPPPKASFHLMVMLNDAYTDVPIPYATVWATISKAGNVVSDERQWPMIARYMGPHYGNDVTLPGAGTYQLSLLISPPVSARHMEYADVWTEPHRVNFTFPWKPVP